MLCRFPANQKQRSWHSTSFGIAKPALTGDMPSFVCSRRVSAEGNSSVQEIEEYLWCSTHVELDDVLLFLPEHQARDAMEAFDGDADGHISAEVPQAHALNTLIPSAPESTLSGPSFILRHQWQPLPKGSMQCAIDQLYPWQPMVMHSAIMDDTWPVLWSDEPDRAPAHAACTMHTPGMRPCCRTQDMKEAVLKIYDNRSNLANTLKDTRTIVGKLEHLLGILLQLIFVFFYLAIFDVRHSDLLKDLTIAAVAVIYLSASVVLRQHIESVYRLERQF